MSGYPISGLGGEDFYRFLTLVAMATGMHGNQNSLWNTII